MCKKLIKFITAGAYLVGLTYQVEPNEGENGREKGAERLGFYRVVGPSDDR